MLIKCIRGDVLKMKHQPITIAHIVIPVIISFIFLGYYSISNISQGSMITAFYEAIGAGLPILIGIFAAGMSEQEQNAGGYQNLCTTKNRVTAFVSKVVTLAFMGLIALVLTAVIFGIGMNMILGKNAVEIKDYIIAALIMWYAGIPLYILHTILAFNLGKGVSIGAGLLSGLISALLLTELGTIIWKYVPFSWTTRIPYSYLCLRMGEVNVQNDMVKSVSYLTVLTVIGVVYYMFWASRWEGNKVYE